VIDSAVVARAWNHGMKMIVTDTEFASLASTSILKRGHDLRRSHALLLAAAHCRGLVLNLCSASVLL